MGWGTFIAGRTLSSARRSGQEAVRQDRDRERAMDEAEVRWIEAVSQRTLLAHPKVRTQVDQRFWLQEAQRLFNRSQMWAVSAVALLWVAVAVMLATADGDPWAATTPWGMAAFFLSPVLMKIVPPVVRHRYLRKINAGFAKAGWPVKKLRTELRNDATAARRQERDERRAAGQQTDRRLYPSP